MKILVIGSGAREHALCASIAKSLHLSQLFIAPGNAGTSKIATNVALDISDNQAICAFAKNENIDLVVVGPEAPLVAGLVDDLAAAGIKAFGPTKLAAKLEESKDFTKKLCIENNIPTAQYQSFTAKNAAENYVKTQDLPLVIKADGLAAGKGVIIANTEAEALQAVADMFSGKFGAAGDVVIIEEFLTGPEVSFFALCDGDVAKYFACAQDHKRAYDNDQGPNTGGMGSFSPTSLMTEELKMQVMETIINPTVDAMKSMGAPFMGVLFAGLILTDSGPKLLEYNVRFGDPETESILPLLSSDIVPILLACASGKLADTNWHFSPNHAVCVIMAARGYPGDYARGSVIRNLVAVDNVNIFHAGTEFDASGNVTANGGRVLAVTAVAPTKQAARALAYSVVGQIDWQGGFHRSDIAS